MPEEKIRKLPLYRFEDYYAVTVWESIFAASMNREHHCALINKRIAALKRYGKNGEFFREVLEAVAGYFEVSAVVVIPGSKAGFNHLQKITGSLELQRTEDVPQRKYDHQKKSDPSLHVRMDGIPEGRILLVDDIITTGWTMECFARRFQGRELVKFAFGINRKLEPQLVDWIDLEPGPFKLKAPARPDKKKAAGEFKNLLEVLDYLKGEKWKISKSTLYEHKRKGLIRPDRDGTYSLRVVQRYAYDYLALENIQVKKQEDDLQRRRVSAEIARIEEQTKREKLKREIEEGKYVLREEFELELAARAAVLDTMRQAAIRTRAAERVALVGGDPAKIPDLIAFDLELHNEEMNSFANTREFHVLLKKT